MCVLSARARQEERIIIKWINLKMEGKMGGSREKNEKISTTVTKARRERERALRVCTFSTRKVFEPISPILSPCEIRPKHATIATFRSSKHSSSCSHHRNRSRRAVVVDCSPSRSSSKNSGIVIVIGIIIIIINQREGEAFWRQNTKTN